MKRRYKEGDWIRIPLDGSQDALGIIARGCRSRLFGYFFAVSAEHVPSHEELKTLSAADAAACALFGGAPLEDARWRIVATSVPFDRGAWPFPQFVSRGAFGRTWSVRTYDPESMQTARTEPADASAHNLPEAHFAGADELEALLRERICGVAPAQPLAVYQTGGAIEREGLQLLARGGRIQFDEALTGAQLDVLAAFIAEHPEVELRVHSSTFDLVRLQRFGALRSLVIDVATACNSGALQALQDLRRLRIGAMAERLPLDALHALPKLRALELAGRKADLAGVAACAELESLTLVDAPPLHPAHLRSAPHLRELTIAHGRVHLEELTALPSLTKLELRDLRLTELPDFSKNAQLQTIVLRNIRTLRDLRPLTTAPALRELRMERMPQLEVWDFEPLAAGAKLHSVAVDAGSRRKNREIYRLLHVGRMSA